MMYLNLALLFMWINNLATEFFATAIKTPSYFNIIGKHLISQQLFEIFQNKFAFGLVYIPYGWNGLIV